MRAARVVCWCTQRALAWFLLAPGLAPAPAPAPGFAPTPDTPVVARMPEQPKQRRAKRRKTVPSANVKMMAAKKRAQEKKKQLDDVSNLMCY